MTAFRLTFSLMILLAGAAETAAQTTALRGRVTDFQGLAIDGATVTVTTSAGATAGTATTAADGAYALESVAPGPYLLQAEAPGFGRSVQAITVRGSSQTVDVVLSVAGFVENVVVAAARLEEELPQEIERAGVRVQTITAAQIENAGYVDVAQALEDLVPGLFVASRSGPFDYVSASFQGSRTNEILWLVDGIRISNRLYNGTTPLDTLPANMIERIEILEGTQGLFYGTQAVGGVVNVVTRAFTENTNGHVQGGLDTNDGRHVSLLARTAKNGNRFVLFASRDQAEGFEFAPESEFAASTTDRRRSYEVSSVGGKYAADFSSAARFSAMYQVSGVSLDTLRPARSSATQPGGLDAAFNDRTEHIFSAKLDYTARQDVDLFFKGYFHQWDSHYSERQNVFSQPGTVSTISDREFWGYKDYGLNVLGKMTPHRGLEYLAGYDFQNYSGSDDVLLIAPNTETVHALFGQVRTTRELLPKATLAFGARVNMPTHSQTAAVWNVSGQYDFTSNVFARMNAGTAFRYPDAYELFAVDPTCCFGNPNLKPESSTNINGSVGGRIRRGSTSLTLEAIAFYREVSDLIVDVDDGSGETTITANRPDKVRAKGASIVASSAITELVSATVGYTYSQSQRTNQLAGGYSSLPGIPSNQVNASVDVHPRDLPFGAMLTVNGVGSMFFSVSGFGQVSTSDYVVADLSGRVFLDRQRRQRVNLRLENMFDKAYVTRLGRNFLDGSTTPFLFHGLGVPRTFHVSYSFSY